MSERVLFRNGDVKGVAGREGESSEMEVEDRIWRQPDPLMVARPSDESRMRLFKTYYR